VSLGDTVPAQLVASAVSLAAEDIVTETHYPQVGSVGLPFVLAELRDRATLERARVNINGFEALLTEGVRSSVHLSARATDGFEIRTRMVAPWGGVLEDPATGSANCALAGLLAHYSEQPSGSFSWRIAQGVEMGRPSTLLARAEKLNGVVRATWVGGASVLVSEGIIHIE